MTSVVRIASLVYPGPVADRLAVSHPWQRLPEIQRVLRGHLPGVTASLFARPSVAVDGSGTVDWYSDLAGQPRPLRDLPDAEQEAVRRLLKDQLGAVTRLADELERRDPDQRALGELLRRSIRYPGEGSVYVVGGSPVLVSWGESAAGRPKADALAVDQDHRSRRWRNWVASGLGLVAVASLAATGWWWSMRHSEQELRSALDAALASQCASTAPLLELTGWLDRVDPDAERYPDIRMAVMTELGICTDGADLGERLGAASCEALPRLAEELALYDLERQPFRTFQSELESRLAACRRVQGLSARLEAASGDCDAVAVLDQEVQALDGTAYPLDGLRAELDQARGACRLASGLGPRIAIARGDCVRVRALAREAAPSLADFDTARVPLRAVKDGLDGELARCDLAAHLERQMAGAQDDCLALAGLKEILDRHDHALEPLAALWQRLEQGLQQCGVLTELEQRFASAQGDCAAIESLQARLEAYRGNLRFLDIRTRLRRELEVCGQAGDLEKAVAASGGDCTKARALAAGLTDQGDPRFAKAQTALKARLEDCDRVDRYARRLADAGKDCAKLKLLERDLKKESAASLRPIRQQLNKALEPCRPKPAPAPVVAAKASPQEAGGRAPRASGGFPMRGDCTGQLVIEPSSGWDGDRVRHVVRIDPPASARVARVTSTNPGCRNCRLGKIGANVWRGDFWYRCGGRGIVPVSYAAYDAGGRLICSGSGSDLCLGRR